MELLILGSSGGAPTKYRNCTSFVLKNEAYGIMFDCAEGTQRQLIRASYKLSKIKYIFISHLHQDHIAGLVPLLSTKSMFNIPGSITIIGPKGLEEYINFNLKISGSRLGFDLEVLEASNGKIFKQDMFNVTTYELNHRVDCFGFRVSFKDKPGNIDLKKAESFGLSQGPILGELQKKGEVETENGIVKLSDIASDPVKGKIFTFISDTYLCDNLFKLAENADMLYIESTFQKEFEDRARDRMHLTSYMCGEVAKESGVKALVLSHFSASYIRYEKFRDDAKELFKGKIYLAYDLESYPIE
ncbi:MAG: ribonuclease [Candidatus Cloacimonadota bacterium]|nr:MAG: ribonuclease [Candidatus Cloacimonadota bacterium]PIE77434.1 MAG: ribonuclease [Candidatus Delongbacteria bacterium]